MAELLSPGVYIEEVATTIQVIQAVSTSTMAVVGYTDMGKTDEAILATSDVDWANKWGGDVKESFVPKEVAAFFANGGRRVYTVRVTPSDAVAAQAKVQSQQTSQQINTGDGATATVTELVLTPIPLKVNGGISPLTPSSLSIRWRSAGTPVAAQNTRNRGSSADLVLVPAQAAYEGRILPGSLVGIDQALDAVVRGTVTIKFDVAAIVGVQTIPIPVGTGSVVSASIGSSTNGATAIFDHRTGRFSLLTYGTFIPAGGDTGNITIDYTPTLATVQITDNGAGALTGVALTANGTINYFTGAYSFTATAAPHDYALVLATYKMAAWSSAAQGAGAWGNRLRLDIKGNADFYTALTASYTKFDVSVLLKDTLSGLYFVKETMEEVSFSDLNDVNYFPDVMGDLSDLLSLPDPGYDGSTTLPEPPGQLNGVARSKVIAAGDGLTASAQVTAATLSNGASTFESVLPIKPRSLQITYTDNAGTARTVTDDGVGGLTGDIDTSGTNTIDYTTGALSFKAASGQAFKGGTVVTASWRTTPLETTHSEALGDATKVYAPTASTSAPYVLGSNGTFTTLTYGRSQVTDPVLKPLYKGLYALEKVDEILQVIVPDFAGNEVVWGDQLDYAASREGLPSGGDRFIIGTVPAGSSAQEAVDWQRFTSGRYSKWAAIYWPWIKVANSLANNRPLVMPPLGHIAGVYARTDAVKNVGKAPAGTVDGQLRYLLGLEFTTTQGDRDTVYPNKINPLIDTPQTGKAVWGVRTIALESEWRYINVRRLFMFAEKSIFNSTHWIVFENNGQGLWSRIKGQLESFLNNLFSNGYLAGNSPSQAFKVTVDSSNNTADSIELGQVLIDVAMAGNKPAEMARFRVSQLTAQAS